MKYTDPDGRTVGTMSVSSFFSTLKNYGLIGSLISVLDKASVDYVEKTEAKERDIQNVIDQIIEDSKPILDIIEDAPSATTDKTHEEAGEAQAEASSNQGFNKGNDDGNNKSNNEQKSKNEGNNNQSAKDAKRVKDNQANKVTKDLGYEDAHDLKENNVGNDIAKFDIYYNNKKGDYFLINKHNP